MAHEKNQVDPDRFRLRTPWRYPANPSPEFEARLAASAPKLYEFAAELGQLIMQWLDDLTPAERSQVNLKLVELGARAHGTVLSIRGDDR